MIDQPMFFEDAVRFLLEKNPNPQEWDAGDWAVEKPAVRVRSFFSSRVESARFLDRAQGLIFDYMAKVRDDLPNGQTALRVGGREDFVMLMREFMLKEGMARPEEFKDVNQADLEDIRSVSRLRLIFDTNVRQAYGYGQWKQGMKPAVRRAFPASRFVRDRGVLEPRPRHAAHLNEVRLKTDFDWWARYQNDPQIGGFGVPWGPYGFYSGMGQEDVSRAEAQRLGLKIDTAGEDVKPLPGLNENIAASVRKMDPETKRKLLEELRGGPKPRDPEEAGREAAAAARRAALERRGLPAEPPVKVVQDGDKIVLENARPPVILSPLPDEPERDQPPEASPRKLPEPAQDRPLAEARDVIRRILSADGTIHGDEDDPYFVPRQLAGIADAASREGFLFRDLIPDAQGGVEHDVTFDAATATVLKFTKPDRAAYAVDFELGKPRMGRASPLDYLDRLAMQNEIFADTLRFVGIASNTDGKRIITRQNTVKGRSARWEEIVKLMEDLGFTKMRHNHGIGYDDSYAFVRDDFAVFDMRPANVFVTDEGDIIPVDCIPVKLPLGKREFFAK